MARHLARSAAPIRAKIKTGASVLAAAALTAGAVVAGGAPAQANNTVWDAVAKCESGGNWGINTGNGYYGGLQFSASTWRAYGGGQFAAYAHQTSRENQILIAQKVLRGQGPGAWPVCSKRAGLTVANGSIPLTPEVVTADTVVPKVRKLDYATPVGVNPATVSLNSAAADVPAAGAPSADMPSTDVPAADQVAALRGTDQPVAKLSR